MQLQRTGYFGPAAHVSARLCARHCLRPFTLVPLSLLSSWGVRFWWALTFRKGFACEMQKGGHPRSDVWRCCGYSPVVSGGHLHFWWALKIRRDVRSEVGRCWRNDVCGYLEWTHERDCSLWSVDGYDCVKSVCYLNKSRGNQGQYTNLGR